MKAKDLLLVGSGLAIGYLIFKKDLFKKKTNAIGEVTTGAGEIVSGAGSVVSGAVGTVTGAVENLVNPKQAECEKKWNDFSSTARYASEETMLKAKSEFMSSCLLSK